MELNHILSRLGKQLSDYIRPDQPGDIPPSMVSAIELAKNNVFAGFFSFREYDDQKGLVHLDDGTSPAIGLIFSYTSVGEIRYPQLESDLMSLLEVLPVGSTMQTAGFVSTRPNLVSPEPSNVELVSYINQARHRAFVHAVEKQRTISDKQGYIVAIQNYLSFRIPFEGDIREDEDIQDFMEAVQSFKEGVIDSLSKYNITARTVTAYEFKLLLRTLLNYATPSEELARRTQSSKTFHNELVLGSTQYTCKLDGGLLVEDTTDAGAPLQAHVATLTCDAFSHDITMAARSSVHMSKNTPAPAIPGDYWVYSTYLKLAEHALNDSIAQYLSIHAASSKNKVDLAKSVWHQKSLKHFLGANSETAQPSVVAKAYTGITLYSQNEAVLNEAKERMLRQYNAQGYRTAEEVYISLLALVCSLPCQLTLEYEHPQKGFRRANIMPQARALSLTHIPDVWYGPEQQNKGTLHLTRQGLVGRFSLYDTGLQDTVIMAKSEAERNTFLKEILVNAMTTDVPLYVIEQNEQLSMMSRALNWSYHKATAGTLPNPYGGITSEDWLNHAFKHLIPLTVDLAYPNGLEATLRQRVSALIEVGLQNAWHAHKARLTLRSLFDQLLGMAKTANPEDKAALIPLLHGMGSVIDLPDAKFLCEPMVDALPLPSQGVRTISLKQVSSSPLSLVLAYLAYNHSILTSASRTRSPIAIVHNALHPVYKNLKGHGLQDLSTLSHVKWIITVDSMAVAQEMEFLKEAIFRAKVFVSGALDLRSKAVEGITPLFTLTSDEFRMLESIANSKEHIEAFVKHGDKSNIFLFAPDMHSKLIYTNAPVELAALDHALDKAPNLYSAIDDLVKGS